MRIAFVLITLVACGGSSESTTSPDASNPIVDAPGDPAMRYEPWMVGARWSYKFTDPTGAKPPATGRLTTIGPEEDVGGIHAGQLAYKVHIETLGGSKDVWEIASGDLDTRYKTNYYDTNNALTETDIEQPYRLKLDESVAHTATGAQYSETFMENITKPGAPPTSKTETLAWKVISDDETVTVIAGTYSHALHIQRYNAAKMETVEYWYARGVGKLKETGGNNDEELESFAL